MFPIGMLKSTGILYISPEAEERYITFGLNEIEYGTGRKLVDVIQVPLPGNSTGYEVTDFIPEGIKHGQFMKPMQEPIIKLLLLTGSILHFSKSTM